MKTLYNNNLPISVNLFYAFWQNKMIVVVVI